MSSSRATIQSAIQAGEAGVEKEYWLSRFSLTGELAAFPKDAVMNAPGQSPRLSYEHLFHSDAGDFLLKAGNGSDNRLQMVLLAGVAVLLQKYSGQDDLVLGTPLLSEEENPGQPPAILPLRLNMETGRDFRELLQLVRNSLTADLAHAAFPLDLLPSLLFPGGKDNRRPLFETVVSLEQLHPFSEVKQPVHFHFDASGSAVRMQISYQRSAFLPATVSRLAGHLELLLLQVAAQPDLPLSQISLLSAGEEEKIKHEFNHPETHQLTNRSIAGIFAEAAEEHATRVAILDNDIQFTYRQLNRTANQLANWLTGKYHIRPEEPVALLTRKSVQSIVALLAILKSGGAYLPLDQEFPVSRISYILRDAGCRILIADKSSAHLTEQLTGITSIIIEDAWDEINLSPQKNPDTETTGHSLAYIMYTSGSTGQPKGVLIEQKSILRLVRDNHFTAISPADRIVQSAPLSFDAATFEIWGALLNGATLLLIHRDTVLNPAAFGRALAMGGATIAWLTASLFNSYVDTDPGILSPLKQLLVGGEALSAPHINKARRRNPGLTIINGYGPTENTTFSACYAIHRDFEQNIPIGKPIRYSTCYVFGSEMQLQPVGIAGELWVGGSGVARGYLNQPEMTAEKFIADPMAEGGRLYRTGDLVRWLPDGNLEFLGRRDSQVKIRGFRIELREIESHLQAAPGIRECLVTARERAGKDGKFLVAYWTGKSEWKAEDFRNYLTDLLPEYMVPSYFVGLDKFPLTPNGKINTAALPEPGRNDQIVIGPAGATEEKLRQIWAGILNIPEPEISTDTSFFLLGGHSLRAAQMLAAVHKELDVEIPFREIFRFSTISALAAHIGESATVAFRPISPAPRKKNYALSPAQKRLYVLQQIDVKTTAYNLPSFVVLEGRADKEKIEQAFRKLIARHESLRTSFESIIGQPFQKIHDSVEFSLQVDPFSDPDETAMLEKFVQPFDLAQAPLFRAGLQTLSENRSLLMLDMHHIISDGVSEEIMKREFMALYAEEELPALHLQYKDYSEWRNTAEQKARLKQMETYWLKQLGDELPILQLPADFQRPAIQRFEGDVLYFYPDAGQIKALEELAAERSVTMFTAWLTLFNITLARITGQSDILVGTPVAGRGHSDLQNMIGMLVNTVVLRALPEGEKTFSSLLGEVNAMVIAAQENQDYPFEELVDKLVGTRDASRNPLFSVMFNLHNFSSGQITIPGLTLSPYSGENKISKFDLSLDAVKDESGWHFAFEYCTALFKPATIERFANAFLSVLNSATAQPEIRIDDIEILTAEERHRILHGFNGRKAPYPADKTIGQLFEERVAAHPQAPAIVFAGQSLNYEQLNSRANQLALRLREAGVNAETTVGLLMERSLELPVAVLGIMKAGGAYVPIDPGYPVLRQKYMLSNSRAAVVITLQGIAEKNAAALEGWPPAAVICIDQVQWEETPVPNPAAGYGPGNLLYVVYTSGTTGEAKGIMIEHRNLLAYLAAFNDIFHQSEKDTVLQVTSISFDIFAEQFFGTLLAGGKLVIPQEKDIADPLRLHRLIAAESVTMISCPPVILNELNKLKRLPSVRVFINGGDVLRPAYVSELAKYAQIYNGYGPAEATIGATHHLYNSADISNIPIGPPMANYNIYLLDKYGRLAPVGAPAEICIAGDGVGRGYFGNPGLTAEKFNPDPFVPGQRMYKTGDLARWLPDGNLEFIGRMDQQVKIRGFRIELGEIETVLQQIPGIREAVVTLRNDKAENYLCAYYVSETDLQVNELRALIADKLPQYMVPAYFVRIDAIPWTNNGKLDHKALPKPTLRASSEYKAPSSPLEERLVEIWSEVLETGSENISVDSDFFTVGGNSINATQLVSKVQKEFGIIMSLVEAFKAPDIERQAHFIEKALAAAEEEKQKAEAAARAAAAVQAPVADAPARPISSVRKTYPLSSGQRRMYILNQFAANTTTYNMYGVFELEGSLDLEHFEKVMHDLVARHESFRTHFESEDGELVQVVSEEVDFRIRYFDKVQESELENLIQDFTRPFDLDRAPLFRVGLVTLRAERYILLMDTHHIIADGLSMQALIEEFVLLSQGETLEPLQLQYHHFVEWQLEQQRNGFFNESEKYWLEKVQQPLPVLDMPTDYIRPAIQEFGGSTVHFFLEEGPAAKLKALSVKSGATMYMLQLAAYTILFHKYTGQEDIIIGSVVFARPEGEYQQVFGMFANTMLMRNFPKSDMRVSEFIAEVRNNAIGGLAHQYYQIEDLVEKMNLPRDLSRNAIFDVMFASQDTGKNTDIRFRNLSIKPHPFQVKASMVDLLLNSVSADKGISLDIVYNTSLYKEESVINLGNAYIRILEAIAENPQMTIGEIELAGEAEKARVLNWSKGETLSLPRTSLQRMLEEQVLASPDHPALRFKEHSWTYAQLNRRVNQLAHLLREDFGLRPNDIAGVLCDRPDHTVIGILAVLKAGGAYLPVEPAIPAGRKGQIIEDSGLQHLLTDKELPKDFPLHGSQVIDIRTAAENGPTRNPEVLTKPEHLAYVMYTSGTTGKPKGVMITHHSVLNHLNWLNGLIYTKISRPAVTLLTASFGFDSSLKNLFSPLVNGATLVVIDRQIRENPSLYLNTLISNKVQVLDLTPGYLSVLLSTIRAGNSQPPLLITMAGGEALPAETINAYYDVFGAGSQLINVYGITECTVNSTCQLTRPGDPERPSIGRPIPNTSVFILDENLQPVPPGVCGELYIGGAGLASGYLNREELNREKFIALPHLPEPRLYRSGDLGYWTSDGRIVFLGRKDSQVKIRGNRIELGEIESALLGHQQIAGAAVTKFTGKDGSEYLAAFLVSNTGGAPAKAELKAFLQKQLPEYMVPQFYVEMEKLPLTVNGKIDRKALVPPVIGEGREYIAPQTAAELVLANIWEEVLDLERVSIRDNFFDLGGHSLKGVRMLSKMHRELGVRITLRQIFNHPTIESLAALADTLEKEPFTEIISASDGDYYPLSHGQQRLWLIHQIDEDKTGYNIATAFTLRGSLHLNAFNQAFSLVIDRHEILRTCIVLVNDEPRQKIIPASEFGFEPQFTDLRGDASPGSRLRQGMEEVQATVFDLHTGPLFRVHLFRTGEEEFHLIICIHHIISDAWSMQVMMREWMQCYTALHQQKEIALPPLRLQYRDYANWQKDELKGEAAAAHRRFWLENLGGTLPVLELATDFQRPARRTYAGGTAAGSLEAEKLQALKQWSAEQGASLFITLLAAVNVLLHRYTGQSDIIIGSPVAGRDHGDLEGQIGFYVNTLALRNSIPGNESFAAFCNRVKDRTLEAFSHQQYPFDMLVEELEIERNLSRAPLFDVMLLLGDAESGAAAPGLILPDGMQIEHLEIEQVAGKFDLSFAFTETEEGLSFHVVYSKDLFTRERAARMAGHLTCLLQAVIEAPETEISRLNYLEEEEKQLLIHGFNDNAMEYNGADTIVSLFEKRVAASPDAVALVDGDDTITYAGLNEKANRIAHFLISEFNIQPEDQVGLLVNRDMDMVAAMLGILKSGGAYVPIDPKYPAQRIEYIISNSGLKAIWCSPGHTALIPAGIPRAHPGAEAAYPDTNPEVALEPANLAYIIYTSGSTGLPKAIGAEHRNTVSFIYWALKEFSQTPFEMVYAVSSYCFDLSIFEIFYTLVAGRKVRILPSPLAIPEFLAIDRQVLLNTVPSVVDNLIREKTDFSALTALNMGGEALPEKIVTALNNGQLEIRNLYGPSETTIYSSYYKFPLHDHTVRIGRPVNNTRIYVLDNLGQLLPAGIPGKIFIGGHGLSRGYLGNPELTAAKFIADPFHPGEKIYDTGDLGKWQEDGELLFLGRIDHQVKLRGYRIEPGEIENRLRRCLGVTSAVVVLQPDAEGEMHLVAYYTALAEIEQAELQNKLRLDLPDYMVPNYLFRLDSLPLNVNGKVDRKALPGIAGMQVRTTSYQAAASTLESTLVQIWEDVLKVSPIGVSDNFFSLGGHSLKAVRMLTRVFRETGVQLELRQLFNQPTIAAMSEIISQSGKEEYKGIGKAEGKASYRLSHGQQRLWMIDQIIDNKTAFNITNFYRFTGDLDLDAVEQATKLIIERHEILRTKFVVEDGEPRQVIVPFQDLGFELVLEDLTRYKNREERLAKIKADQLATVFDLEKGGLFRIRLLRMEEQVYYLLITQHHIISDGWSIDVMVKSLMEYYDTLTRGEQLNPNPLRIQYKDFAQWEQNQLTGGGDNIHRRYWLNTFGDSVPLISLPADFPRPEKRSYLGDTVQIEFEAELVGQLQELSLKYNASLFITTLAAVHVLLRTISRQSDIVIGTPVAGRDHWDLEEQLGFYVNLLALRHQSSPEQTFSELLGAMRDQTLEAFSHQVYSFDRLVDELDKAKTPGRSPLFDVLLLMQNANVFLDKGESDTLGNLKVESLEVEEPVSKYDLSFGFSLSAGQMVLNLQYSKDLFLRETVEKIGRQTVAILKAIGRNDAYRIEELEAMAAAVEADAPAARLPQTAEAPAPAINGNGAGLARAIRFFTIPYAGGTRFSYSRFNAYLPGDIEMVSLEYPGRNNPAELKKSLEEIVDALYLQVKHELDKPYAIFGHSMGALAAFLLAEKIIDNGHEPPLHLFVSGHMGPPEKPGLSKIYELPGQAFMSRVLHADLMPAELLANRQLMDFIEPILRADYEAIDTFSYSGSARLPVSFTVMHGEGERYHPKKLEQSWSSRSSGKVTVHKFAGGHFFLFDHWEQVTQIIGATIRQEMINKKTELPELIADNRQD